MRYNWAVFLDLARDWVAQAQTEPDPQRAEGLLRSAVSRAYFAAFNHALEYATAYLGFVPRAKAEERSQDHGRLKVHLKLRRRNRTADYLAILRQTRNECDYLAILTSAPAPQLGQDALDIAGRLFASLPPPPPRTP